MNCDDDWQDQHISRASYDESARDYSVWSSDYDRFPGLRPSLAHFEALITVVGPVLDVGCGGGRDSRELALSGFDVISLDYSLAMLRAWPQDGACSRVAANFAQPPFGTACFAGIWACASLFHVPLAELAPVVRVLYGLLKPGGVWAASMREVGPGGELTQWGVVRGRRSRLLVQRSDFVEVLIDSGAEDIHLHDSGPGWYTAFAVKTAV